MELIAQFFGLGAMTSLFFIYQQKSRKKMLFAKLSADVCWVIHYACLGGIAGMIPNTVGIFRELVFIHRKSRKWASCVAWPVIFIFINWILGFRTFHSWYNLLPIVASTFVTISLWMDHPRLTKIISVPISGAFWVYDAMIGSYIGMINESIAIISIAAYFVRGRKTRRIKNET